MRPMIEDLSRQIAAFTPADMHELEFFVAEGVSGNVLGYCVRKCTRVLTFAHGPKGVRDLAGEESGGHARGRCSQG